MSQAHHHARPVAGRDEARSPIARELPLRCTDRLEVEETGSALRPAAVECLRLVEHGTARPSRRPRVAASIAQTAKAPMQLVECEVFSRRERSSSLEVASGRAPDRNTIREVAHRAERGFQEHAPEAASRFSLGPNSESAAADASSEGTICAQGSFPAEESCEIVRSRGDIVADLYKSLYYRVFCFARRSVSDDEAEEIAHETFVRLLRVRNLERMTISVAYLLRIAENLLKRKHERATRYRSILERTGMVVPGGQEARANEPFGTRSHDEAAEWLDADRIDQALRRLTSEEQTAIRLIVCEGLDYQAAARSMGVRVSTINNWKHRGLAKLKQLVGIHRPASRLEPASAVSVAI